MAQEGQPGVDVPDPRWGPAAGDTRKDHRLKRRMTNVVANHAGGQGLEACLTILLQFASGDGQDGRPKVDDRTRRLAASDYIRHYQRAVELELKSHEDPEAPAMPTGGIDGVVTVRVREVEAIIRDDASLKESIRLLQRTVRASGGPRVPPEWRKVDPSPAPAADQLPPGASGGGPGPADPAGDPASARKEPAD